MKKVNSIIALIFLASCLDPYYPPEIEMDGNGLLVVDGFLNPTDTTVIKLTRTQPLHDTEPPPLVGSAKVSLETGDGEVFRFRERQEGHFHLPPTYLVEGDSCRLQIEVNDKTYRSAFVPVKYSPPIDSVTWKMDGDYVQFYVTSHDPNNDTGYYLWQNEETWKFRTRWESKFKMEFEPRSSSFYVSPRHDQDQIWECYRTVTSPDVFIESTGRLSQDVVYNFELEKLPGWSERFSVMYSLLVRQRAITEETYEYYKLLNTGSHGQGTLFDAQPVHPEGNIRNVDNPMEPVIGLFMASSVSTQRIFVDGWDVPVKATSPYTDDVCETDSIRLAFIKDPYLLNLYEVIEGWYEGSQYPVGYIFGNKSCVDCRLRGKTEKPDFWVN